MPEDQSLEEFYYVNGINGSTGTYIEEPLKPQEVGEAARGQVEKDQDQARDDLLSDKARRLSEASFQAVIGTDLRNLGEAGWSILFAKGANPGVKDALKPLIDYRHNQAGDLFKVYEGDDGYLPGDTWEKFRIRHRISPSEADPKQMPYYLLIVGDPQEIPYDFQYQADVERAVGRIHFEELEEYAYYAQSVAEASEKPLQLPRRVTFFGTSNPDDRATKASSQDLIAPLAKELAGILDKGGWQLNVVAPEEATKERLNGLLGGPETPALLFTASHGVGWNSADINYPVCQGALVTQEWPGPEEWRKRLKDDFFFASKDLDDQAKLWGMIAVFFACFGAGTPRKSDFYHLKKQLPQEQLQLAERALLAPLPKKMLAHPKGGVLAVAGHVERTWTTSFKFPDLSGPDSRDLQAFQQLFSLLLRGYPIGAALEDMNSRYANLSTNLTSTLYPVLHQDMTYSDQLKAEVARLWTANNDARNFILVGDPAVTLPVTDKGQAGSRPDFEPAERASPAVNLVSGSAQPAAPQTVETPVDAGKSKSEDREEKKKMDDSISFSPPPAEPDNLKPALKYELDKAYVKHVKDGYSNTDAVFKRIMRAFLISHYSTVIMYWLLFAVGVVLIVFGFLSQNIWATIVAGFGVAGFVAYFITRSLTSVEQNLIYITWLGVIYNTYWVHQQWSRDPEKAQQELDKASNDSIRQIKELLDRYDLSVKRRPVLKGSPPASPTPKPGEGA